MCLCGLLSLSLSVHLICCIEVFFSMVLLIQAPDLLTMDGTYFYFLGLLDGGGESLFALHVISKIIMFSSGKILPKKMRRRRIVSETINMDTPSKMSM
ncbi:hypothetical protein ANCDUO_06272 [Ancylostoma duodenale]|uniref:Uncharacterized protein n=1 Tax=Ancylostoma duodenale TaxID=51022 RepID=A0A0C2H228_9BILA|nr:hypothetical protein ANCDUO_06272 [Ancylostoma duodenale]